MTAWTAATIITGNAITLGSDTLYIDATDAANLTADVGTGEYTLGKEFGNVKSGENSFKVTASGNYKVNGTTITLANVNAVEIGGINYVVDAARRSRLPMIRTA